MKHHGRPRKNAPASMAEKIEYAKSDISQTCPTLNSLVESGEFNLLDLSRLQADVERLLASTTQRMVCLSAELHHEPIPAPILRNLGLLEPDESNRPTKNPCELQQDHLVVTSNPNKPLSLIISQRRPSRESAIVTATSSSKPSSTAFPTRMSDLSNSANSVAQACKVSEPSSSPDKSSSAAHDIPNRFWALMEPYCADITEANISYLESILKSYVEEATTAKYFQIPPFNRTDGSPCHSPSYHHNHPTHMAKRLRRECQKALDETDTENNETHLEVSSAIEAASEMVSLARRIDVQLRQSLTSSSLSAADNLVQLIEDDLYQESVSSVLCSAVARMAKEESSGSFSALSDFDHEKGTLLSVEQSTHTATSVPPPLLNGGSEFRSPSRSTNLTSLTAQPLKNLARQLQVSSSFRVEKKVAQAMEELGLFPLTLYLNHMAQRPVGGVLISQSSATEAVEAVRSSRLLTKMEPHSHSVNPCEISNCEDTGHHLVDYTNERSNEAAATDVATKKSPEYQANGSPAHKSLRHPSRGSHTTALHTGRNSRRNSHNVSNANKEKSMMASSPLVNGFATSEDETAIHEDDFNGEVNGVFGGDTDAGRIEDEKEDNDGQKPAENETELEHDDQDSDGVFPSTPNDVIEANNVRRSLTAEFEVAARGSACPLSSSRSPIRPSVNDTKSSKNATKTPLPIFLGHSPASPERFHTAGSTGHQQNLTSPLSRNCAGSPARSLPDIENDSSGLFVTNRCISQDDECASVIDEDDDDLSGCLLSLVAAQLGSAHGTKLTTTVTTATTTMTLTNSSSIVSEIPMLSGTSGSGNCSNAISSTTSSQELSFALLQRQRELLLVCAANHSLLHRLAQAARRDIQRQEIQRRLAIADADVIEAYNKLESYKLQRRPALKRDRDAAWKTLKERQKVRNELEAFDRKAP